MFIYINKSCNHDSLCKDGASIEQQVALGWTPIVHQYCSMLAIVATSPLMDDIQMQMESQGPIVQMADHWK